MAIDADSRALKTTALSIEIIELIEEMDGAGVSELAAPAGPAKEHDPRPPRDARR